ncbi:MAG: M50 family metallopeptidase [Lachnospiraceae bacterium]|nr:M50 family metallopeptidase [Lachnospiraceae bacterium]
MGIIFAVLIFGTLILVHEFGHYLLAKLSGIVVLEFSLGMGPRLCSIERGGTRYSLKLFPFGGSCQMLGEDMADLQEGSFGSKSVWKRIAVVAAGPLFNFLLALGMAVILVGSIGWDEPIILGVYEDYPACEAGMQAGDVITSINGKKIDLYREVSEYIDMHQDILSSGKAIPVTWQRGEEKYTAELTPKDNGSGRYILGIQGTSSFRVKGGLRQTLRHSVLEVRYAVTTVIRGLQMIGRRQVTVDDMAGPVGIAGMIGETYQESKPDGMFYVWINMLNIAILLSANLGVVNLLPLPALDGGRLLFLLIEALRRKRMDPELEGKIHLVGMLLLLALMAVIMGNDIRRLFV